MSFLMYQINIRYCYLVKLLSPATVGVAVEAVRAPLGRNLFMDLILQR